MSDEIQPREAEVPHVRLMTAVVMMSLVIVSGSVAKMTDWPSVLFHSVGMLIGCWISYFGIYRTKGLHYLWGWSCLLGSVFLLIALTYRYPATGETNRAPITLRAIIVFVALPTLGYLLVIDGRVREYRRSIGRS